MAVRSRIDELEEWCFWYRSHYGQGTVSKKNLVKEELQHYNLKNNNHNHHNHHNKHLYWVKSASVPSPEYSDSLDSTLTLSQCSGLGNDFNFNNQTRELLSSEPSCSSLENSPCRLFNTNLHTIPIARSVISPEELAARLVIADQPQTQNTKCPNTSDDMIPVAEIMLPSISNNSSSHSSVFNRSYKTTSQQKDRIVKNRVKSPELRTQLRYIQSAKGTWTYNF